MSLPGLPFPALPADRRLADLRDRGRLVELTLVRGGDALETGFGYGTEFWWLDRGVSPDDAGMDLGRAVVDGARLITESDKPIATPDALLRRGVKITRRMIQI